jgi:hypothetical protein
MNNLSRLWLISFSLQTGCTVALGVTHTRQSIVLGIAWSGDLMDDLAQQFRADTAFAAERGSS